MGVEAVYLASEVILHPARIDPFPVVILDAMSWSRVVIGSDGAAMWKTGLSRASTAFPSPRKM